ncbi:MAG: phosphoribosylglycinamide formyltransferase [Alistipes sp.]|nr:phosphoribosylglycinamide formyltransferase [Alistipes sp.]
MKKIAIFASGSGSNAENIITYFSARNSARVELILSNRSDAMVLERAKRLQVEAVVFDRDTFYHSDRIVSLLRDRAIDYVVLAGFLWLVPANLLAAFPDRIVNIHPALLPRHGGKGMYGDRVHRAVVEAGDAESGITIHRVNEVYDSGDIVAQYRVPVMPSDTPEQVASKVHALEYQYFPIEIEKELLKF